MKKLRKKIVALFLTAAMVVSLAPAAFAGSFSDVKADASYAGAVERLAGLGIIAGMGDGTFQPDGNFTRAQAAKIAVMLRGVKNAGTGATEFSDVPATHWASGWINLASGLGIIKGKGNGKFDPEGKVTHAEWLTMVLRVLGYGPQIDKMAWPAGALAKAALLGLDNGVNVVANLPASRAEVAVMSDNALTAEIVDCDFDANGNATNCRPQAGKTVAKNYLKATSIDGVLTDSPELFTGTSGKITVDDGVYNNTDTHDVTTGANYQGLLGHKVTIWTNSDGKVFFIEDKSAGSVVTAKAVDTTSDSVPDEFQVNDKKVDVATVWQLSKNFNAFANGAYNNITAGDTVTAVKDADGKIAYVIYNVWTKKIVDSTSTLLEKINFAGGGSITLKDDTVNWSGAASKLADVQKGDVVQYIDSAGNGTGTKVNIIVTRNTKTGTFSSRVYNKNKVTVGGTDYDTWANAIDETLLGKEVKITLDKDGQVAKMEAATTTTKNVGVVVSDTDNNNGSGVYTVQAVGGSKQYVDILKADGNKVSLEIKSGTTTTNLSAGNVVEYTVNSSGQLDGVTLVVGYNGGTATSGMTVDKDNHRIDSNGSASGGGWLAVTGDTLVLDYTAYTNDEADIKYTTRAALENNSSVSGFAVADPDNAGRARAIIVTAGTISDKLYGLVTNVTKNGDGKWVITVTTASAVTGYIDVAGTVYTQVTPDQSIIEFTAANGELKGTTTVLSASANDQQLDSVDTAAGIVVANGSAYSVTSKTQLYDLTGASPKVITLADVAKDSNVSIYDVGSDGVAEVIVVK